MKNTNTTKGNQNTNTTKGKERNTMNAKIETYSIIKEMENCKTYDELKHIYRLAVKPLHPDNSNNEGDIEKFLEISEAWERINTRFVLNDYRKHREKVRKATTTTSRIFRKFESMEEFFGCDGLEQLGVIHNYVVSVSKRLRSVNPKPNAKQITDKTKADDNGNFDGMRSYVFAHYIFNKNGSINEERVEEVSHNAWIKLHENHNKPEYHGLKPSTLLWISCRQATYNTWYNEAKTAKWFDRSCDLYDINAYETTAPIEWTTEATACHRVDIELLDADQIIALASAGYSTYEIADFLSMNQKTVWNRLEALKAVYDIDRLQIATGLEIDSKSNASPIKKRKALIMKAIQNGMSYKRIAFHIGLSDLKDKDGNVVTVTDQIRALLTA